MAYKMIFIVNKDLKMGKGKIAAQVAHAAVALFRKLGEKSERVKKWEESLERKVVVRASLDEMLEAADEARKRGIPYVIIRDGGLTQVPPGSITVVGIGPGSDEELEFTAKFKLL